MTLNVTGRHWPSLAFIAFVSFVSFHCIPSCSACLQASVSSQHKLLLANFAAITSCPFSSIFHAFGNCFSVNFCDLVATFVFSAAFCSKSSHLLVDHQRTSPFLEPDFGALCFYITILTTKNCNNCIHLEVPNRGSERVPPPSEIFQQKTQHKRKTTFAEVLRVCLNVLGWGL